MDNALQTQTRSYGRLVVGAIALHRKRYAEAIDAFRGGLKLHESWYGHELLGEAYSATDHFAEALAEWEVCLKRRGEVTDVFFADTSTLRYLPPVYYWLARAQEALGTTDGSRRNYGEFLKLRSHTEFSDPLTADAIRRLGR